MITKHGYSLVNLRADYFRAFVGFIICFSPYVFGAEAVGGVLILLGCAALFVIYGLRTSFRHIARIELDEHNIAMKIIRYRAIPWNKLSELSLSYFTTWRSGGDGWMQLRLKGAGHTFRLESNLSDFEQIVRRAVSAAIMNKLELSSTTLRNIDALNIRIPENGQAA
tara:strand:- start:3563 stop:4063 length:501 start_codon:yes stop_codon:yes gene_type:complete